eukprot:gnl/MRDRNA2_/MRDRNA2_33111_c0_seq1.p1 gnl/MRDRNA2_/MRDRNA2_33111_c0~~gnl/MRDRNA2_/MRDRNA2_33111_c0_seq1.p1  ORF type:complete len:222 (+),score=38.93 gnl/MRDRNA2_/MRDRNA2_33111_c0_seq1:128-793(+)
MTCCSGVWAKFEKWRDGYYMLRGDLTTSGIGEKTYWNTAYKKGRYGKNYEWLQSPEVILERLQKPDHLGSRHDASLIHVGCGNSKLGRQLWDAGFKDIVNVDYSPNVISMMKNSEPELSWLLADCCEPGALGRDGQYDFALDKGGLDALLEAQMIDKGRAMIKEVHRVIKPDGKYIVFSLATPKERVSLLKECFKDVAVETIEGYSMDIYYKLVFVFTCTK